MRHCSTPNDCENTGLLSCSRQFIIKGMVEVPRTPERRQEEPIAQQALARLMQSSKFTRLDASTADTTIENNGQQFQIEMVPDGKSETLSKVQKLFIDTFGAEEVDPEEILRHAVDGENPWGETGQTMYRVHVVKDSKGEVVSTVAGGRLQLFQSDGQPMDKQMFMIAYAVTDKNARQGGLAREAYISAIMQAAKDAQAEGKKLSFAAGECTSTSEEFWNSVGWKRPYAESASQPGTYEELRYVQPALDFDPATGAPTEDAGVVPEHMMIDSFEGTPPTKEDVLAAVRAFYTWNNTWPEKAFDNPEAFAKHREHVQEIWKEFKKQVQETGSLTYLDKKSRAEQMRSGLRIKEHDEADHGNGGPEDF